MPTVAAALGIPVVQPRSLSAPGPGNSKPAGTAKGRIFPVRYSRIGGSVKAVQTGPKTAKREASYYHVECPSAVP